MTKPINTTDKRNMTVLQAAKFKILAFWLNTLMNDGYVEAGEVNIRAHLTFSTDEVVYFFFTIEQFKNIQVIGC